MHWKSPHQHLGPLNEDYHPAFLLISRGENEGTAKARTEISQMGPLTRNLCQTWTRLWRLSWAPFGRRSRPTPALLGLLLGRRTFSFCVRSFRQADSRKADGGNSGTGSKPVGISLELDWDPSLWAWDELLGSWVWLQIRKLDPPQPRGQARGWVQAKPPHKGPLWPLSLALGSASPSGSRKMLPVWQLQEQPVLGPTPSQGTGPTPRPPLPRGILTPAAQNPWIWLPFHSQCPWGSGIEHWPKQYPWTRIQHSGHFFSSHCPQEAVGFGLKEGRWLSRHIADSGRVWVKWLCPGCLPMVGLSGDTGTPGSVVWPCKDSYSCVSGHWEDHHCQSRPDILSF